MTDYYNEYLTDKKELSQNMSYQEYKQLNEEDKLNIELSDSSNDI